jgi:NAD(P)H-nitrite reductase large subunit
MYVIIGGGVAAVGAIEGIRSRDARTPITLVSKESYLVYGRPLIAEFLKGERTEGEMLYREPAFYAENKVTTLLGEEAARIDTEGRKVELASGKSLGYRKLLIATGGVPFIPPMEGLGPDVYTFTTLDDAKRLAAASEGMGKAVVIGGGLIGLKVAEGLHARGVHVTIVELAPRIL